MNKPDRPAATTPGQGVAETPGPAAGSLFVVVAPSGAGKTSLVRAMMDQRPGVELSVSFTTRAPRASEVNGHDYWFVDRPEFERRRAEGEFLEWAEVHGNFYGTSRAWISQRIEAGRDIVLEIDWQGATQVQRLFPDAVGIFIAPPSLETLRERMQHRGQDAPEVIEQRMAAARSELEQAWRFQYVIINQEFATALRHLISIVESAGLRFDRQRAREPELFDRLFGPAGARQPPA